jgi:hypothetical protein
MSHPWFLFTGFTKKKKKVQEGQVTLRAILFWGLESGVTVLVVMSSNNKKKVYPESILEFIQLQNILFLHSNYLPGPKYRVKSDAMSFIVMRACGQGLYRA